MWTIIRRKLVPALLFMVLIVFPGFTSAQTTTISTPAPDIWTVTLGPGAHYISFPQLPDSATLDQTIGDQLPGAEGWSGSSRMLTAGGIETLGAFYSTASQRWEGTLRTLGSYQGYWLVIPEWSGPVTLTLSGTVTSFGPASGSQITGTLVGSGYPAPSAQSGVSIDSLAGASYEVISESKRSWKAESKVFIQNPPTMGTMGPGSGRSGAIPYVAVPLDSLYPGIRGLMPGIGNPTVYLPFPGLQPPAPQAIPRFDVPPWGDGPPPQPK